MATSFDPKQEINDFGYTLRKVSNQLSCSNNILRLNDFATEDPKKPYGKPTRSRQSLKAIVQVEIEAIAEVTVNAWPFLWRQVDT